MQNYDWPQVFAAIYRRGLDRYRREKHDMVDFFPREDVEFLSNIGCSTQELFDFIEDFARYEEPDFETVLLVTSARRDYFLVVQKGECTNKKIDMDQLPPKDAELDGIAWLPRIIEKARAKLRGEMPPELMFLCGGDRPFLQKMNASPADFLRVVWQADKDTGRIVEWIKKQAALAPVTA